MAHYEKDHLPSCHLLKCEWHHFNGHLRPFHFADKRLSMAHNFLNHTHIPCGSSVTLETAQSRHKEEEKANGLTQDAGLCDPRVPSCP